MGREDPDETAFTWPLLGALYGSLVIVAIVALLSSHVGRGLDDKIGAPARTLIAVPVLVFVASMVTLLLPAYRRVAMRFAEIASWMIPAWLVMGAMVLGAISFALDHAN